MSKQQNWSFPGDGLDPMTLILKFDLDIVKMYHHIKKEFSMSTVSKVVARLDRQTHTQTHRHADRHKENIAGGNNHVINYRTLYEFVKDIQAKL